MTDKEQHGVQNALDHVTEGYGGKYWMHELRKGRTGEKMFWITVLVVCVGGLTFHCYKNISVFLSEATSSEINPWVPDSIPDVLYCPSTYFDYDYAQKLTNWSKEEMYLFDAFFPFGIVGSTFTGLSALTPYTRDFSIEEIVDQIYTLNETFASLTQSLQAMVKKRPELTYEMLLDEISVPKDIISTAYLHAATKKVNISTASKSTMYGKCVLHNFSELKMTRFEIQYFRGHINLLNQDPGQHGYYYLFIGAQAGSVIPSAKIELAPHQSYVLYIEADHVERIGTPQQPCRDTTEAERSVCLAKCFNQHICDRGCSNGR